MPESFKAKGADQTTARDVEAAAPAVDVTAPSVDEAEVAATKEAELQKNKEELKEKIGEQRRRRRNTSEEPNSAAETEMPQRRFERRRSRDATSEQENGVSDTRVRRRSRTPSIDQGEMLEAAQQNGNGVRRRSRTPLESQASFEEKNMFSATVATSHRVRRRSRDENSLSDAPELPSDIRRRPKVSRILSRIAKFGQQWSAEKCALCWCVYFENTEKV